MTKFAGGVNSRAFFPNTVQLTSLEELSLYKNKSIVQLWDKEPNLHSFRKLKVLEISDCHQMETIGPPSMFLYLVQLKSLEICNCDEMQQVISDDSETREIPIEVITFTKLEHLSIYHMKNLECFYGGSYKMSFPRLQKLDLFSLTRMTKFAGGINSTAFFPNTIEFPCLEALEVWQVSDEVRVIWELREGEAQGISSNPLPKLEELKIEGCSNSALQFVKDDGSSSMLNFCGQLKSLELDSTSTIEMTSLHSFTSLRELSISGLTSEYLFSVDRGFEQLQSLEQLCINDCPNMKVIIQGGDNDKALVFPRLKRLNLMDLESMSKLCSISDIPLRFPSLEVLFIQSCNKLESLFCGEPNQVVELPALEDIYIWNCNAIKSFSTRPLKAPKLRALNVCNCPEMEWFLLGNSNCNADLELPSLEKVIIEKCPNMKSFSPAVLRAPKLQLVEVDDKPYPVAEIEDFNHFLQSANSREQTAADKIDL